MFCTNCGNNIEQHAKFCSKCGTENTLAAAAPPSTPSPKPKPAHDMQMHINVLSWLMIGDGILIGLLALPVMFFGQLVRHFPMHQPADFPFPIQHFAGSITTLVGLFMIGLASAVAAAGVGLMHFRSWGRGLAIVMAILIVFSFPVGTAIAIYAFWVLFSREGQEFYRARSASTMA